jgi:type IV pilus assembly protein PilM
MLSVGMDISSNKVTIVELLKSRKGTMIKNAANFKIPPESINKGEIQDPVPLSKGLRQTWKRYKISGRNIYIGISNLKVIVKEATLPLTEEEEINNSLKYQINDFIPIARDNLYYDYYIMEKREKSSKIMLVGAMKSMISNVIESVRGAGLIVQAIDLNCFSLFRTLELVCGLTGDKKTYFAVNIGPEISIIEVIKNSTLRFPRFLSNSTSTFINSIEGAAGFEKNLSRDIAYSFDFGTLVKDAPVKKKSGNKSSENKEEKNTEIKSVKEEGPVETSADNQEISIEVKEALEDDEVIKTISSIADNFVNEVKMSIEHYIQEDPGVKIEKILLTGENLKNFDKYIQYRTKYRVERLNISDNFSMQLIKKNSIYRNTDMEQVLDPLAIGMALRGISK